VTLDFGVPLALLADVQGDFASPGEAVAGQFVFLSRGAVALEALAAVFTNVSVYGESATGIEFPLTADGAVQIEYVSTVGSDISVLREAIMLAQATSAVARSEALAGMTRDAIPGLAALGASQGDVAGGLEALTGLRSDETASAENQAAVVGEAAGATEQLYGVLTSALMAAETIGMLIARAMPVAEALVSHISRFGPPFEVLSQVSTVVSDATLQLEGLAGAVLAVTARAEWLGLLEFSIVSDAAIPLELGTPEPLIGVQIVGDLIR
jgi:hypothetical protein